MEGLLEIMEMPNNNSKNLIYENIENENQIKIKNQNAITANGVQNNN